jgi:DNA-binding NtrC family response regulator/tetratricopeptide (TPR) repeat protein
VTKGPCPASTRRAGAFSLEYGVPPPGPACYSLRMASPSLHAPGNAFARRYVLHKKLGSGSLGSVYLAVELGSRNPVALKIIHAERLGPSTVARMQDEFRAIATLNHPQIAKAFDFGYNEQNGTPYYTREYVQGAPLPPGPPDREPPSRFLRPILDLLDALEYIHEQGILHLDIHAGNLIVADQPERGSVLIDIGLLRPLEGPRLTTSPREWTLLPPEALQGGALTPRTDLFLVGRLLQFRLKGRMDDSPALPKEIPGWGTRLTLELERIISKALQRSPEQRFATAAELRDALSAALGEEEKPHNIRDPEGKTVGRETVLAELEQGLRDVAAGGASLVWLTGKPGSGKTHILSRARVAAQLRGLRTIQVGFLPGGDSAGSLPAAGGWKSALSADLNSWLEPLNPRHGGTPYQRAQRAADAYFAEAGPPLVFLLDDFDHAEAEDQRLIEALAARCSEIAGKRPPGRGLGIIRCAAAPPGKRAPRCTRIRLEPLKRAEARDLFVALLRPLVPPDEVTGRALSRAGGVPLRLRRIARALRQEWLSSGAIPRAAEVSDGAPASLRVGAKAWKALPALDRSIVEVLSILRRPASLEELARALDVSRVALSRSIRRLVGLDFLLARDEVRPRRFELLDAEDPKALPGKIPAERVRAVHERMASWLEAQPKPGSKQLEHLARHLLALGRGREGRAIAVRAAKLLRANGSFDRAVRLLEEAAAQDEDPAARLQLVEEISDILEETGDHERGIRTLEPWTRGPELPSRSIIPLRRRLGIHYHRAGFSEKAKQLFEATIRIADPAADAEDLIFIDTELAELQLFQGALEKAEEACQRGLTRLQSLRGKESFSGRMEVMLRASLGHIELRRMALDRAKPELERALRLSREHATTGERATILHNLAIVENQLNDLAAARGHFHEAERMLHSAGESRNTIKISTNLAVLEAKLGNVEEAQLELDRAARLLHRYPGQQLEFFFTYSLGIVSLLTGKAEAATRALSKSLALGGKLGDVHLVRFGEVHLAEAQLLCGRYERAMKLLRASARRPEASRQPLLLRMIHARLQLVEALLGDERRAARSRELLAGTPASAVGLLEAWNDFFLGAGELVSRKGGSVRFARAHEVFKSLRIPFGQRFARLGLLLSAIAAGDSTRLPRLLEESVEGDRQPHPFLDVSEALLRAVAHSTLGHVESAEEWLSKASSAMIGSPFLELDWSLECLRASLALRAHDSGEARRHLHRSLHARDLLLEMVPARSREPFLSHPRFALLTRAAARLETTPAREARTENVWRSPVFEGMVGRSATMLAVFKTIDALKDHENPVLISGETGTGKDLVARALFRRSLRRGGPFLAIHCASIPEELFEAELFGCKAGSYTGADADRPGVFETLHGGTVLLDDIESLSPACQAKILRTLDAGSIRPVGGTATVPIDVRFLFATSVDLAKATADGRFRRDLYFRIRQIEISLPPLRSRKEDVPLLARHFLEKQAARLERPVPSLEEGTLEALARHDWPGNVRELEAALLRATINLSPGGILTPSNVEPLLEPAEGASRALSIPPRDLLSRDLSAWRMDLERDYLIQLFLESKGRTAAILRRLQVKRTRLYAWFRELGIDVKALRARLGGGKS